MNSIERKAPIDPVDDDAVDRGDGLPPGTPTDPAEILQQIVDPDEAGDPEKDPRAGTQR